MRAYPETATNRDRLDEFTTIFIEGNNTNQSVWEMIDNDTSLLVDNIVMDAPADFDYSKPHTYATFISAPVRTSDRIFGMLTINAKEAGDLSEEDRASITMLARLLATAEALVNDYEE